MKHALRKISPGIWDDDPCDFIPYTKPDGQKEVLYLKRSEILIKAACYIEDLEKKVDELEYIQRIINAAEKEK
jgi:hypothetical protein